MTTPQATPAPQSVEVFDFARAFLAIGRDGQIRTLPHEGRTPKLDGLTVGVWVTAAPAGHGGEMHPDGDEVLYVLDGEIAVEMVGAEPPERIVVAAGQGCVVRCGVWHRVVPQQASRLLHMTPGPAIEFRPAAVRL